MEAIILVVVVMLFALSSASSSSSSADNTVFGCSGGRIAAAVASRGDRDRHLSNNDILGPRRIGLGVERTGFRFGIICVGVICFDVVRCCCLCCLVVFIFCVLLDVV